jgi:hypothetical protein
MKKVFQALSLTAIVACYSCKTTSDVIPQETSTVETGTLNSAKISAIITQEYPTASNIVVNTLEKNKVYGADFIYKSNNYSATIDNYGKIVSSYNSSTSVTLPEAITKILDEKYPGYKLLGASKGKDSSGGESYKVSLSHKEKMVTLIFDSKNAIIFQSEATSTIVKTEDKTKFYSVKLADLPATIQTQLTGYEFIFATVKSKNDGTEKTYYVSAKKDGLIYDFVFDNDGKLVSTKKMEPAPKVTFEQLTDANTPAKVKEYIAANHKGWKMEKGYNTLKNGVLSSTYVVLSNDKNWAFLDFDAEGKLVKSNVQIMKDKPKVDIPVVTNKALTTDALPKVISDYLTKTYAGWKLEKGNVTLKNNVADIYYVYITSGDGLKYHVYFDKDGKFFSAKRG